MGKAKIVITLDEEILEKLDRLIDLHVFPNRSRAIQEALEEKLERLEKNHPAEAPAKQEPSFEPFADEGEEGTEPESRMGYRITLR
jgi:Arc/MetJ-type ribon-helix-helix transcriptional regulator